VIRPNSLLFDAEKYWESFKTWFGNLDFELSLLYRGSEQKFTSENFLKLVGKQGPTLHLIQSEHDYLFGGCAFEKYPSKNCESIKDDKAFLFKIHP
jgi:hypothetical protein